MLPRHRHAHFYFATASGGWEREKQGGNKRRPITSPKSFPSSISPIQLLNERFHQARNDRPCRSVEVRQF